MDDRFYYTIFYFNFRLVTGKLVTISVLCKFVDNGEVSRIRDGIIRH